jgi:hypothetical protein
MLLEKAETMTSWIMCWYLEPWTLYCALSFAGLATCRDLMMKRLKQLLHKAANNSNFTCVLYHESRSTSVCHGHGSWPPPRLGRITERCGGCPA